MLLPRFFLTAAALVATLPAFAHEFWIEPLRYQVASGENLQADFKNGQEFKGNTLAFFDRNSARFEMILGDTVTQITPRAGDSPALDVVGQATDGLAVVVHETTPSLLTYREWEKFLKFAAHKDFPNAAADHLAAGWSQERFRESYTRHVKTLIAIGSGQGEDKSSGLATEFIALTNPYVDDFNHQMKVLLTFENTPRPNAQVEVFERSADGAVSVTLHRTGKDGVASIPVKPGHDYLFDAVVLRPFDGADTDENTPVWATLWAALTFSVPQ